MTAKKASVRATETDAEMNEECLFCNEDHLTRDCRKLAAVETSEKEDFVRKQGVCYKCLRKGHLVKECTFQPKCSLCDGRHPTALHGRKFKESLRERDAVTLASVSRANDQMSSIVPVRIQFDNNEEVITYAMLDSQSDTSFISEELAEKLQMPLEKVRKVMKIAKEPISLETPIGDEEDSQLGDFIEDKNAVLPLDSAIQENLKETTTRVLASLTPREERVLRMRFGIGMNTDHTLEEVGQQFSVTRERIRQIEAKALRKLKHPSRSRKLRSFLDQ